MADKPSRALILYGDGLTRLIDPSHSHLHSLASLASCGFLSLPKAPPSESEDDRIVREFAILLDSCEPYLNSRGDTKESSIPTISERFMGMRTALVTSSSSLELIGSRLGFAVLHSTAVTQSGTFAASELLKLLGFLDGKTHDTSQYDLVFVHIGASEKDKAVECINSLVGGIMNLAQPGSEISPRLHFSVVTSYGSVSKDDDSSETSILVREDERSTYLSSLFPRQSYTMRGENKREDVRHYCPMLMAQWQYAVTRTDMAKSFTFRDFKKFSGNLVIPADRMLHEVAFKLWKAPKYGA